MSLLLLLHGGSAVALAGSTTISTPTSASIDRNIGLSGSATISSLSTADVSRNVGLISSATVTTASSATIALTVDLVASSGAFTSSVVNVSRNVGLVSTSTITISSSGLLNYVADLVGTSTITTQDPLSANIIRGLVGSTNAVVGITGNLGVVSGSNTVATNDSLPIAIDSLATTLIEQSNGDLLSIDFQDVPSLFHDVYGTDNLAINTSESRSVNLFTARGDLLSVRISESAVIAIKQAPSDAISVKINSTGVPTISKNSEDNFALLLADEVGNVAAVYEGHDIIPLSLLGQGQSAIVVNSSDLVTLGFTNTAGKVTAKNSHDWLNVLTSENTSAYVILIFLDPIHIDVDENRVFFLVKINIVQPTNAEDLGDAKTDIEYKVRYSDTDTAVIHSGKNQTTTRITYSGVEADVRIEKSASTEDLVLQ